MTQQYVKFIIVNLDVGCFMVEFPLEVLAGELLLLPVSSLLGVDGAFMADEIEDSLGNDITLEVFRADLESLEEFVPLPQGLGQHLLVVLEGVEDLDAKLLVQLHHETRLVILVLHIFSQIAVDVSCQT